MESKLAIFTQEIKNLKSKYGNTFFEKSGLYAVIGDLAPNIDKKFISVLKKADEVSLPQKIVKIKEGDEAFKTINLTNLRQDFTENTGLDATLASVIFDTYLYGLDLKQDFDLKDYKVPELNNGLQIEALIELALADGRLERNEIKSIYAKALSLGIDERDVFKLLKNNILNFKLQPSSVSGSVDLNSKEVLLKYDWVNEEIFKSEKKKIADLSNNEEREKRRLSSIQREQTLSAQKEKELELKKLELELKKEEQLQIERLEKLKIEQEKNREIQLKKQQRKQKLSKFKSWFLQKNNKGQYPVLAGFISIVIFGIIFGFYLVPMIFSSIEESRNAKSLSTELDKKYEIIQNLILDNNIERAKVLLVDLVHDSDDCKEYNRPNDCKYSYQEYWRIKREELRDLISNPQTNSQAQISSVVKEVKNENDDKKFYAMDSRVYFYEAPNLNSRSNTYIIQGQSVSVSHEEQDFYYASFTNNQDLTTVGYIVKEELNRNLDEVDFLSKIYKYVSDPDGWVSLRSQDYLKSSIIKEVGNNVQVKILNEKGKMVKVKTPDYIIGYIFQDRLLSTNKEGAISIEGKQPWEKLGYTKDTYEYLKENGYLEEENY